MDCPTCEVPMDRVESQDEVESGKVKTDDPTYPTALLPSVPCWVCEVCGRVVKESASA